MRLQRVGRRNDPSYRVVITDSRTGPKSNKHVDLLGSYNPRFNHVQIDGERAKVWISKGVQPSPTVHNILVGQKIIEGKKVNVLPKKSPIINEEAAKKAAEESAAKEEVTPEASIEEAPADDTNVAEDEQEKAAA
ncbi:MAG: 30S ribosomal protein S16 [Candidatus Paceibacterota bacterium]